MLDELMSSFWEAHLLLQSFPPHPAQMSLLQLEASTLRTIHRVEAKSRMLRKYMVVLEADLHKSSKLNLAVLQWA